MFRIVTRHFWWKVTSLALAFGLWLLYSGAQDLTTSISAQVQYRNIPRDLEISSDIVESVHLVIRGPSPLLSRLTGGPLPVVIDLAETHGPGQATFTIDRRNVTLPTRVVLERTIPSQVRIRLENRITREVPVRPRFENLPAGMLISDAQVIPGRLILVGPQSRVSVITQVETDPLDLSGGAKVREFKTIAVAGDPQVNFTTRPAVTVRVTLGPRQPESR